MENCIFCKIAKGDIPADKVYEDELTIAFLDIHPVNPGHTLVVPKHHAFNLLDIEASDWAAMTETVRKTAKAIHDSLGADGINLQMNNREHAGQVVDHPHIHIIPRYKGDGLRLWHGSSYKEGEAAAIVTKIKAAL